LKDDIVPPLASVLPVGEIATSCLQIGNGYKVDIVAHDDPSPTEISHNK
jgi:hypothetical protein